MRRDTAVWILSHWRELAEWLPAPGTEWKTRDIDEFPYNSGQILTSKGIVDHVTRSEYGQPAEYETNEDAYKRIHEYREQAEENGESL